jgi:hypothetical protein
VWRAGVLPDEWWRHPDFHWAIRQWAAFAALVHSPQRSSLVHDAVFMDAFNAYIADRD